MRSEVFPALCGCMYWCQSFPSMFVCLHLVSLSVGVLPQSFFTWRLREAISCERLQEGGCEELLIKGGNLKANDGPSRAADVVRLY